MTTTEAALFTLVMPLSNRAIGLLEPKSSSSLKSVLLRRAARTHPRPIQALPRNRTTTRTTRQTTDSRTHH